MSAPASYADQARRLLASQFAASANLHAVLAALVAPFQELEVEFQKLLYLRHLSLADGIQLDRLGELIGEARSDRPDVEYRAELRNVILQNVHDGTPDAFIRLVAQLAGANTSQVEYEEEYPAGFNITNNGELVLDLIERLRPLIPAGVGPVTVTQSNGSTEV